MFQFTRGRLGFPTPYKAGRILAEIGGGGIGRG
jgi:hypothetical protein